MKKGRLIIDFESKKDGECGYKLQFGDGDKLDDDNIVSLLEHIIREKISWE